jgi:hypothetical protein
MFDRPLSDHLKRKLQRDQILLSAIQANQPRLESLLAPFCAMYEDGLYRFYHHSFKVYQLQDYTSQAVEIFRRIASDAKTKLCEWFEEIVAAGTGLVWESEHNQSWTIHTRPIVEAFLHARYFLEMMTKYGRELEAAPTMLPTGWAAVLELYDER